MLVLHMILEILQSSVSKSKVQPLVRILSTMFEVIKCEINTAFNSIKYTMKEPLHFSDFTSEIYFDFLIDGVR